MTAVRIPINDKSSYGNPPGSGPLRPGGEGMPANGPTNNENLPSTLSAAAERQREALTLVRDLWAGNQKIKAEGETYLPKGEVEGHRNYATRLKRAVLDNVFRQTIIGLTGFIYRDPPKLGDDVPELIRGVEPNEEAGTEKKAGLWENIDNAGTHGDVFARDITADAMCAGHAAILVEFPNTGGQQTYKDEITGKVRPYFVPIKKENILSWRSENVSGKTVLTQVVLLEKVVEPYGLFGEKLVDRYRVLYNSGGTVGWVLLEITPNKIVVQVGEGLYPTQDEIPIAEVVTAGRIGLFESEPPFLDLAHLNLAHYRQWSDYDTSIYKTCVPILFTSGFLMKDDNGNEITVGADAGLNSPPPDGDAKYVTHSGEALASCKASLDDLKNAMAQLGLAALATSKRTAETATAKEIDQSATDSALAVTARGAEDGLERALYFMARYLGEETGGSVELNKNFTDMTMDAPVMSAWASLATALSLPPETVIRALITGGRLPEDTDIEGLVAEMEARQEADRQQKADELRMSLEAKAKPPTAKAA